MLVPEAADLPMHGLGRLLQFEGVAQTMVAREAPLPCPALNDANLPFQLSCQGMEMTPVQSPNRP